MGSVGGGGGGLRLMPAGANCGMDAGGLARAMENDHNSGLKPFFVCATVGTTSSNAIDPLPPIGPVCQKFGAWLHVDSPMSATAALCPEFRYIHDGIEHADSYCFNPPNWMFTTFSCAS